MGWMSLLGGAMGSSGGSGGGNKSWDALGTWQNYEMAKKQREWGMEDAQEMIDYQMQQMQDMFPFTNMIQDYAMDLYSSGNLDKITDFLEHPTPPSNLERQLFEFFGGTQPEKGYYRTGGGQKGGPGALTNRLLGRYGAGESGPMAGLGQEMLDRELGLLESLIPYGQELASGGFRTDIGPAQDYAMNLFEREMMPTVAERFGGNISGSGFNNEMGRTMSDLGYELGALQVSLDEAAANRRLQGLSSGTVQNLFAGPMNRATGFLSAGAQAGQAYTDRVNQARPGYGLLNAMPMFADIATSGGFIQPGFPTSGTDYGNLMSAMGQTGAGLMGGLGDAFGQWMANRNQNSTGGGQPANNSLFGDWPNNNANTMNSQQLAGSDAPGNIFQQYGYA